MPDRRVYPHGGCHTITIHLRKSNVAKDYWNLRASHCAVLGKEIRVMITVIAFSCLNLIAPKECFPFNRFFLPNGLKNAYVLGDFSHERFSPLFLTRKT